MKQTLAGASGFRALLAALTLAFPGAAPTAWPDGEVLALIHHVPEAMPAEAPRVYVKRAGSGVEPAFQGMELYADDCVITKPDAEVTLEYLDQWIQPLLTMFEDDRVCIVDTTAVRIQAGRLFASVSGHFRAYIGDVLVGILGSEVDLVAGPRGGVGIQVLAGSAEVSDRFRVDSLQQLSLSPDRRGTEPIALQDFEVAEILDRADKVRLAAQPSFTAEGDPPYFHGIEKRSAAYRKAHFGAVWDRDPRAWAELGRVYADWAEPSRALSSYKVAGRDSSIADSAELREGLARAYAGLGRLDLAEKQAKAALEIRSDSQRARITLGNVFLARAEAAEARGAGPEARSWLDQSLGVFSEARTGAGATASIAGVAATNQAKARTFLARLALADGDRWQAEELLEQARQDAASAREQFPDYPFAELAEGELLRVRALVADTQEDFDLLLSEAERIYHDALSRYPDLAQAYYRLGELWEARGDLEAALELYRRSVRARPSYAPAYRRLYERSAQAGKAESERYRSVYLRLSGTEPVPVPNLIGLDLETAREELEARRLVLGEVRWRPSSAAPGSIVAQDPKPSALVQADQAVAVEVAVEKK